MRTDGVYGFYPLIDDISWLPRLLPLGVKTVQLRIKHASAPEQKEQIAKAVAYARGLECQLVINDHWEDAIACKANAIHLGQEDLETADIDAIRDAGISFGISTHSLKELETALAFQPNYIALGPIYPPTSKHVASKPQGLDPIRVWKRSIDVPLVVIGGITLEKAPEVLAAGADSIAVIGDIFHHKNPEQRVKEWLHLFQRDSDKV